MTATPPQSFVERCADPGPLGLSAFALTTIVLSTFNAGLVDKAAEPVVFGLAFFFGGMVQIFAGMWEFVKGNTFGALAFSSYGAFWMALWYIWEKAPMDAAKEAGVAGKGVGLFLLGWTILTFYMWIASFRTNGVLAVVFTVLLATFIALTAGDFAGSASLTKLGGYLGILTALGAFYGAAAGVINSTFGKPVVPTWPISK